jgi:alpha-amylase/alpha-mannosidase (GH57 family)
VTVRAVFLWHLHQPEYRDPLTGKPVLPWVRLHATRAYTDMAAALEKHPSVQVVANFAPSLLLQLEAFASGASVDRDEEIARKPASALSTAERAHVIKESFSVDWDLWVRPVPRYAELLDKRGQDLGRVDLASKQGEFSDAEVVDLQVHFILAWMGFWARREEPLILRLLAKGRGFSHEEKVVLLDLSRAIAGRVVPRYRALAARGQIEITCSPLFHPILPLLIDSDSARRAMPQAQLPPRFQHPEDAREQVTRGLSVAERSFGVRPCGMWPSEGSVSPEVADLFLACGLRWCATDEGNLARSELAAGVEPPAGALHHRPYLAGAEGKLSVLFRDREISDLIGFRYARSEAVAAAQDLLQRIAAAKGEAALVTVALDGENPWERYPRSGELFLDALYGALGAPDGPVRAVLPRDELTARPAKARIARLHSGSWIDSNYRIWIGDAEDNQAWALLGAARGVLAEAEASGKPSPEAIERARMALFAAEGSDWFWWYGDDFQTDNAPEFDALFRRFVAAAYTHLELPPPERLGRPIIAPYKDKSQAQAEVQPPRRLIMPAIDGHARGYYEWSGAGWYRPGASVGGSMYQGTQKFSRLWFGFSLSELFLRLDPELGTELSGELRLLLTRERKPGAPKPPGWSQASLAAPGRDEKVLRMRLSPGIDEPVLDDQGKACGSGRAGAILELSIAMGALGLSPGDVLGLSVRVMRDDVELDRLPRYGELSLVLPDRGFERANWRV